MVTKVSKSNVSFSILVTLYVFLFAGNFCRYYLFQFAGNTNQLSHSFLVVFSTTTNQTVIQTYNSTTYISCNADESSDNDTLIFNSGATEFDQPLTISIPLVKVGSNFFLSDAGDGAQCQQGMRFDIKVGQGSGLPPSLNQPPPPLYTPPPVAEPPPVFQGSGGGQGERIHNGGRRVANGVFGAAVIWLGLIYLGLGLGLIF